MPTNRVKLAPAAAGLAQGFKRIKESMELPGDFPPEVLEEAERIALRDPEQSDLHRPRLDVDLITIDPAGSKDLDQAFGAVEEADGYMVRYAIADPAVFVDPGGAVDREARKRGQTLYAPDGRIPLYPPAVSEGAASLLANQVRPAVLWELSLDERAVPRSVTASRALVRSRQQLSYEEAQAEMDGGSPRESLRLLEVVGRLRQDRERERGGIHVELPDQEVLGASEGYRLEFRGPLPVEDLNAQISLMTGMAAAQLMLAGGVGLLRTMPPPKAETLERLRSSARALGLPWPKDVSYQALLRALDPSIPRDAAFMTTALRLFRAAEYVAFDGSRPADADHHAIAAPYAHVTAPLRRLADRVANEVALALCAGQRPPAWAIDALPDMPHAMKEAHRRAGELERRVIDFVEAWVLKPSVGRTFQAVVVEAGERSGTVQLKDRPVLAHCGSAGLTLGAEVEVRLTMSDPARAKLEFELVR